MYCSVPHRNGAARLKSSMRRDIFFLSFFHTRTDKNTKVWHSPRSEILRFYITGLLIRSLLSRSSIQVVCLSLRWVRQPISERWQRRHFRFFRNKSREHIKIAEPWKRLNTGVKMILICIFFSFLNNLFLLNTSLLASSTITRLPQNPKNFNQKTAWLKTRTTTIKTLILLKHHHFIYNPNKYFIQMFFKVVIPDGWDGFGDPRWAVRCSGTTASARCVAPKPLRAAAEAKSATIQHNVMCLFVSLTLLQGLFEFKQSCSTFDHLPHHQAGGGRNQLVARPCEKWQRTKEQSVKRHQRRLKCSHSILEWKYTCVV